jgi:hypothetical protein
MLYTIDNQKKAEVAIFMIDKIIFKQKPVTWYKGINSPEGITIVNAYAPNIRTSKCIKYMIKELKGERAIQ